nr:VOC family protein [Sphingopyxis sp.]
MENQGPTTGLTPHLAIPDKRGAEAIDFYGKAFGATEQARMLADDGVRLMHAHLIVNGASLMMHDDFPEYTSGAMAPPSGVTLHLQVDDTDAWYDRAIAAGYKALTLCSAMFNAGRTQAQAEALELTGTYPQYDAILQTLTAQVVKGRD